MTILETITDGLCSAKNAIVDVAQDVVEKSHQKALKHGSYGKTDGM